MQAVCTFPVSISVSIPVLRCRFLTFFVQIVCNSETPKCLILLASRKGIEPLTPGLGNLCSILLSYRDPASAARAISRATAPSVSMIFRPAHLLWLALAARRRRRRLAAPSAATARVRGVAGERDRACGRAARAARRPGARAAAAAALAALVGQEARRRRRSRRGRTAGAGCVVDLVDDDGQSRRARSAARAASRAVRPEPETRDCDAERLEAEAAARAAGEGVWAASGGRRSTPTDVAALRASRRALRAGCRGRCGGLATGARKFILISPAAADSPSWSRARPSRSFAAPASI